MVFRSHFYVKKKTQEESKQSKKRNQSNNVFSYPHLHINHLIINKILIYERIKL